MMDEQSYLRGEKQAYTSIMMQCLRELGFENAEAAAQGRLIWLAERHSAVYALRDLCEDFGDNDWPDELHLGDVIEKHLARPLHRRQEPMPTWSEHQAGKMQLMKRIVARIVPDVMHKLGIDNDRQVCDEIEFWLGYWHDCINSGKQIDQNLD